MKIIDAKGLSCPQPLLLTRKALLEGSESFKVIVDDLISKKNIERFLNHEKQKFDFFSNDDEITISVTREDDSCEVLEEIVEEKVKNRPIYVFKTDGVAEDELGRKLTFGFLQTMKDVTPLPEAIIFYHKGVMMVLDDSPVLEPLKELGSLGIQLAICGDCVKFYDVVDRIAVGEISNGFDILTLKSNAHHLVYP